MKHQHWRIIISGEFEYQLIKKFKIHKQTMMKEMDQPQINPSRREKCYKKQPFIVNRQQYKELNLYEKKGHWSQKEKLKYILFLDCFKQRFQVKAKRRFNNIFDFMSIFIKTRNSHQCRSHHQKMQKEKFAIDRIINSVKQGYSLEFYESMQQRYWDELECIEIDKNVNFEEFRKRIQKQQQKKQNQRQKIAQNKRILRSTVTKTSNTQGNTNKLCKVKNKLSTEGETQHKKISPQSPFIPLQEKVFKIQQVQNQQSPILLRNQPNNVQSFNVSSIQPILGLPFEQMQPEIMFQPYCFVPMDCPTLSDLESKQKQHMNLAYIHYNQYLTHSNNANNIYIQLLNFYQTFMPANHPL